MECKSLEISGLDNVQVFSITKILGFCENMLLIWMKQDKGDECEIKPKTDTSRNGRVSILFRDVEFITGKNS